MWDTLLQSRILDRTVFRDKLCMAEAALPELFKVLYWQKQLNNRPITEAKATQQAANRKISIGRSHVRSAP